MGSSPFDGSGITAAGAHKFPNPFCDIASEYVPRDLTTIFEWCEYIFLTFGTYRAAARRVVRYFLTELVLEGESESEREKYQDFLTNDLHIIQELAEIGDDYMTYGNSLVSIYFPFDRFLVCPDCHTAYHAEAINYRFIFKDGLFVGNCSKCQAHKTFKREDRRSPAKEKVKLIRWNPKHIRIRHHPISSATEYYYEMEPIFVQKLREGNRFYINDTPWSMIKAAMSAQKTSGRALFKFRTEAIYHMKDSTLAGLPIKGWGVPPIMPIFKLAYYIQLLRRYDEAIALDFIIPFRILYPTQSGPQGDDPLQQMSMGNFIGHMNRIVASKRRQSPDVQVAPFQIGYEMLGGEAQQLTPKDLISSALDELLNAMGFPAELYKGSLNIQAFPVALRLFEKNWNTLVDGFNTFIRWLLVRLSRNFLWAEVSGELRSVTLADDIERKALALQASAGMDISKATAYRPLGIDFIEEQKRVVEEQEEIQKLQQEAMERQEAAQMGPGGPGEGMPGAPGGMPGAPGGMPGGAGGMVGASPGDVYAQGQQIAQQLLLQTPASSRRGELIKIKHSNPTLHAIVIQEMDNMRQEFARQGQAMMMEQAKQASADGKAPMEAVDMPSPTAVSWLISDQLCDYSRNDLRKIARDVGAEVPGAKDAFSYVYARIRGWR